MLLATGWIALLTHNLHSHLRSRCLGNKKIEINKTSQVESTNEDGISSISTETAAEVSNDKLTHSLRSLLMRRENKDESAIAK